MIVNSSNLKLKQNKVEYHEKFQVSGLKSAAVKETIIQPFSSLRCWSAVFQKQENGKLFAGIEINRNDDFFHAAIYNVQFTVCSGSATYESGDTDFPDIQMIDMIKRVPYSWGFDLRIPANQDFMVIKIGLIFSDYEKHVKAVNDYTWTRIPIQLDI